MSDMATDRITVRLDPGQRRRLEARARRDGSSESEEIRRAIERYLRSSEKPVTCYDLARRLGIIGRVRTSPRDLSTNRKYLQGFGR